MIRNQEAHLEDLIRIGILNLEDLEINRSGRLSDRQKRGLYFYLAFWSVLGVIEAIVLIVFIGFQIFKQGNFIIAFFGVALFVSLSYMCWKEALPFWNDLKNDQPKSVAGQAYKDFHLRRGQGKYSKIAYCSVRVGKQVFTISPTIYDHILHERVYRVYYVENTRKIINIQPL